MEEMEFSQALQDAVNKKLEWFNTVCLEKVLTSYRLIHTCIKNMYDLLVKRSLIADDPYRLDRRIHDIVLPETSMFSESEMPTVFGARLSDYETMLDFICTYFRFSVENMGIPTLKKLIGFNNYFDWENFYVNSSKINTRSFAVLLETAKTNSDSVTQSTINDCIAKCKQTIPEINKSLQELGVFQKELYKCELRKDLFEHPEFNREKAKESEAAEMAEIKRIHAKVANNKEIHLYSDLINEIIKEDHSSDKEKLQQSVLKSLNIKVAPAKTAKAVKKGPDSKELLMVAVNAIGIIAPILGQLRCKLIDNFELLYDQKKTFFARLARLLKKAFSIKPKKRILYVTIKDSKTGAERSQKLVVSEFLEEITRKEHAYNGIATRGPEYAKIDGASEDAILIFVGKQISEVQSLYTTINALDDYFKTEVEVLLRPKVKGMKIELSTLKNAIIGVNKRRGEYVSFVEESEQMKNLGIVDV